MSMLSSKCDGLRKIADELQNLIGNGHNYTWQGVISTLHYAQQVLRDATDTILELREMAQEANAENAKLRELCAEMFEAVKCCCGEWCTKTASNCDNNECGWRKCYVALRELGVEVDG